MIYQSNKRSRDTALLLDIDDEDFHSVANDNSGYSQFFSLAAIQNANSYSNRPIMNLDSIRRNAVGGEKEKELNGLFGATTMNMGNTTDSHTSTEGDSTYERDDYERLAPSASFATYPNTYVPLPNHFISQQSQPQYAHATQNQWNDTFQPPSLSPMILTSSPNTSTSSQFPLPNSASTNSTTTTNSFPFARTPTSPFSPPLDSTNLGNSSSSSHVHYQSNMNVEFNMNYYSQSPSTFPPSTQEVQSNYSKVPQQFSNHSPHFKGPSISQQYHQQQQQQQYPQQIYSQPSTPASYFSPSPSSHSLSFPPSQSSSTYASPLPLSRSNFTKPSPNIYTPSLSSFTTIRHSKSLAGGKSGPLTELESAAGEVLLASTRTGAGAGSFVWKLYHMLLETETQEQYKEFLKFTPGGKSFVIKNSILFAKEVLPRHYKHNNFSSFVRQLNMYGFHKINKTLRSQSVVITPETQTWEFSHPKFVRGLPQQLEEIKRKAAESDLSSSTSSSTTTTNSTIGKLDSLSSNDGGRTMVGVNGGGIHRYPYNRALVQPRSAQQTNTNTGIDEDQYLDATRRPSFSSTSPFYPSPSPSFYSSPSLYDSPTPSTSSPLPPQHQYTPRSFSLPRQISSSSSTHLNQPRYSQEQDQGTSTQSSEKRRALIDVNDESKVRLPHPRSPSNFLESTMSLTTSFHSPLSMSSSQSGFNSFTSPDLGREGMELEFQAGDNLYDQSGGRTELGCNELQYMNENQDNSLTAQEELIRNWVDTSSSLSTSRIPRQFNSIPDQIPLSQSTPTTNETTISNYPFYAAIQSEVSNIRKRSNSPPLSSPALISSTSNILSDQASISVAHATRSTTAATGGIDSVESEIYGHGGGVQLARW